MKEKMIARLNKVPEEFFKAYAINLNSMSFQMHFDSGLVKKHKNGRAITVSEQGYVEFPITFDDDVTINVVMT